MIVGANPCVCPFCILPLRIEIEEGCPEFSFFGGRYLVRVFGVHFPVFGITPDVTTDDGKPLVASDDVFVVIALPETFVKMGPIAVFHAVGVLFGGQCFKSMDNIRQRKAIGCSRPPCLPCSLPLPYPCEYRFFNADDPMDMVGHDDEFIEIETGIMIGDLMPNIPDHDPGLAEMDFRIDDLPQKSAASIHADGYEV